MPNEDAGAGRVREIMALATVEMRHYLGRSRSGIPRTKIPADLDPARLEQEGVPGILLWPSLDEADPAEPRSRVGGYPNAAPDPRIDYVPPPDDPWVVLLQVASNGLRIRGGATQWQMQWMDVGFLCFFIRRSAFEARNWSKVVAVLDG